jgi:prepilin peptidase CpaA
MLLGGAPPALKPPAQVQAALLFAARWLWPALTLRRPCGRRFAKDCPPVLDLIVLLLLPGSLAFAAAMDLLTMTIPNRIALVVLLAFFPAAVLAGISLPMIGAHLATGLCVLLLGMVFFFCGWCGGGDAKLLAAIALWLDFDNLFQYLLYTAVAGGMLATALSMLRSVPLPGMLLAEAWAVRLYRCDAGIPYGIALAAGALLVYPHTSWFARLAG